MHRSGGSLTARYVHSSAVCDHEQVGKGTRVWQFVVVLPGARIGDDCNICAHVLIEGDVTVGDRVTIKSGVQLWDGTRIGDDVFIGPNATFTNDPWPRSGDHPDSYSSIVVEDGASIGANATILPGVTIGRDAMVGAGAVVTHDVRAGAVVVGNPAHETGEEVTAQGAATTRRLRQEAPRATLRKLTTASDERGALTAVEFAGLPFTVRRLFVIRDVPDSEVRGAHAHRECAQLLVCLSGRVRLRAENGRDHALEADLGSPDRGVGVHVPPMLWLTLDRFDGDTVLLVLASHPYDPSDYIRDRKTWEALCATS